MAPNYKTTQFPQSLRNGKQTIKEGVLTVRHFKSFCKMDWLFGRKPAAPPNETDRAMPLHFFEDSALVQGNNMAVSLVFDEVLDPEKLRASLEGLVKREGWQRLGGRLMKNGVGRIEWHVPAEFTDARPAINYSHVEHDIPASGHAAASTIPRPSDRPCVVGDPDLMAELA